MGPFSPWKTQDAGHDHALSGRLLGDAAGRGLVHPPLPAPRTAIGYGRSAENKRRGEHRGVKTGVFTSPSGTTMNPQ